MASHTCDTDNGGRPSSMMTSSRMSFQEFLVQQQKDEDPRHLVVGNPAGDADSIISALCLAYIDSVLHTTKKKTPLVSITQQDFETQRPEVAFLVRTLGLEQSIPFMRFIDDAIITSTNANNNKPKFLTLMDHNKADESLFPQSNYQVVEILDHHFDEQRHLDTCNIIDNKRNIAFDNDQGTALVASTCTLVAERLKELMKKTIDPIKSYPHTVATLLLATILLDSVNMIPAAGKGTPRDAATIQDLLNHTDWSELWAQSPRAKKIWWPNNDSIESNPPPDTDKIFESLQSAKFDPKFWNHLSVVDALRLDYKQFSTTSSSSAASTSSQPQLSFGASSVLIPLRDFVTKPNFHANMQSYLMEHAHVEVLVILFAHAAAPDADHQETTVVHRELLLYGIQNRGKDIVSKMALFLTRDDKTLELEEINQQEDVRLSTDAVMKLFDQHNSKASRKQIAPLMIKFLDTIYNKI